MTNVLTKLKEGNVPVAVRQSAARGVLPVGQEELLAILIFLTSDPEPEIQQTARETIRREFSDDLLKSIVESSSTPVEVLEYFGTPPLPSAPVLEAVILNRATPDSTVAALAGCVDSNLMEVILINLMRLLRSPFILDALEKNSQASPDVTRRLREIREEFFEKRNNFIPVHRTRGEAQVLGEVPEEPVPVAEESQALALYSEELREGEDVTAVTLDSLADDGFTVFEDLPDQEKLSTIQKIARMTVAERVQSALKGTREERVILIRDSNRIVASAVLESPKLTDSEVEAISLMKNVSQEVLRVVGTKREFIKNYVVVHNLVKNPRTPLATSMGLLNRILTNDMRALARNKNIPETLRKMAHKQLQVRTAPKESRY
ncbi:MAG: hypothetical protein AB1898_13465 [Acidobacteriota bacterium]